MCVCVCVCWWETHSWRRGLRTPSVDTKKWTDEQVRRVIQEMIRLNVFQEEITQTFRGFATYLMLGSDGWKLRNGKLLIPLKFRTNKVRRTPAPPRRGGSGVGGCAGTDTVCAWGGVTRTEDGGRVGEGGHGERDRQTDGSQARG